MTSLYQSDCGRGTLSERRVHRSHPATSGDAGAELNRVGLYARVMRSMTGEIND